MGKDKIRMPSAQSGLVRYFDSAYKSRFVFKPHWIVATILAVCIAILGLHVYWAV